MPSVFRFCTRHIVFILIRLSLHFWLQHLCVIILPGRRYERRLRPVWDDTGLYQRRGLHARAQAGANRGRHTAGSGGQGWRGGTDGARTARPVHIGRLGGRRFGGRAVWRLVAGTMDSCTDWVNCRVVHAVLSFTIFCLNHLKIAEVKFYISLSNNPPEKGKHRPSTC